MSLCELKDAYLDRRISEEDLGRFESHMENCEQCHREVALFRNIESTAADWRRVEVSKLKAEIGGERIVARAKNRSVEKSSNTGFRPLIWAGGLAATAAVLVAVVLFQGDEGDFKCGGPRFEETMVAKPVTVEGKVYGPGSERPWKSILSGEQEVILRDEENALLRVGEDVVGLGPGSRARIEGVEDSATVRLFKGRVACSVSKKKGANRFEVVADHYKVIVVGTRFSVSLLKNGHLEVLVDEGVVRVSKEGEKNATVRAGQIFRSNERSIEKATDEDRRSLGSLLEPSALFNDTDSIAEADSTAESSEEPASTRSFSGQMEKTSHVAVEKEKANAPLETWRGWVVHGRLADAEKALLDHLKTSPSDSEAWFLLASCYRKAGNWEGAVAAYSRLGVIGSASKANRARFMAGTILQDNLGRHEDAIREFEACLVSRPEHPETMVRLSRSLLALGRKTKAKQLLEEVVAKHPGATAAIEARKMLNKIDGSE